MLNIILKSLMFLLLFIIFSAVVFAFFMLMVKRIFIIINEITPEIDEIKEIINGNLAVSEYYSRIISFTVISTAIIISVILVLTFSLFIK